MNVQINPEQLKVLEEIARQQQRKVDALIQEAIETYLASQAVDTQFEADVERIMSEHHRLLDELAKQ